MIKKMFSESLYKNSMYLIISSASMALFGFIFWSIAARMFPSEQVGLATAVISAIALISSLSLLGFNVSILKYKDKVLGFNALLVTSIVSLLLSIGFLLFVNSELAFLSSSWVYIISFIVFCLFNTVYSLLGTILISQEKQLIVLVKDVLFSVVKVTFVLLLSGLMGLLWSWFFGIFLALVLSFFFISLEFKFDLGSLKKTFSFTFYNYLSSLLGVFPALILPLIIINYLSPSYSAYFYVSWMIANLLFIVPSSVGTNLLASGDLTKLKKSMLFTSLLLVLGIIIVFFMGSFILNLFNPEYIVGLSLLYILAISSIPYGVRTLYNSYLNVLGFYKRVMFWNFVVLLITVVGTVSFISDYGLVAIGYSWLLGNVVGAVGVWYGS